MHLNDLSNSRNAGNSAASHLNQSAIQLGDRSAFSSNSLPSFESVRSESNLDKKPESQKTSSSSSRSDDRVAERQPKTDSNLRNESANGNNPTLDAIDEDVGIEQSLEVPELSETIDSQEWHPELLPITIAAISVPLPQQELPKLQLSSTLTNFTSDLSISESTLGDSFFGDSMSGAWETQPTLVDATQIVAVASDSLPPETESLFGLREFQASSPSDHALGNSTQFSSVTETTTGSSAQPAAVVDNVNTRVVDGLIAQAKLSEAGDQKSLVVQLHPAELGQVTLRVDFENDRLTAKLLANEHVASEILAQNKDRLVTALAENGINFDSLEVAYENPRDQRDQKEDARNTFFPLIQSTETQAETVGRRYYDARNQAVDIVV